MAGGEVRDILDYHERTKHAPGRYARSPGFLDWASQPKPFRRFGGAGVVKLPFAERDPEATFSDLFERRGIEASPLTAGTISSFLELSLALSAWKSWGEETWALRINPSSGNLHPTEAYLALPAAGEDLSAGLYHYEPYLHALERRAGFGPDIEAAFTEYAGTFLVGLTSIHWREAWKYGERAFRYSNLDMGHALACISFSAALQGRKALYINAPSDGEIRAVLGLDRTDWPEFEEEAPGPLLLIHPVERDAEPDLPAPVIEAFGRLPLKGKPGALSTEHRPWHVIDEAVHLTEKKRTPPFYCNFPERPLTGRAPEVQAAGVIRKRRSAHAYDPDYHMQKDALFEILELTMPRKGSPPFDLCPGEARIHPVVFAHRVDGLPKGLYILVRNPAHRQELRGCLDRGFLWREQEGLEGFYLLREGDFSDEAGFISCRQEIARDGAAAFGMLARFREEVAADPSLYRRLHWEAGMIGQTLYLGAEAWSMRGTGIGCYFDDLFHEFLGLRDDSYRIVYNFTMGKALEDPRLLTLAAYHHLKDGRR